MGYTNYWDRTEKPITEEFVEAVKKIIEDSKAKGIMIRDYIGEDDPVVTMDEISFNGDASIGADHETCYFDNKGTGFNFCKTAEKPYDYTVKEVLKVAEQMGIVTNVSDDGETEMCTDAEFVKWREEQMTRYPLWR